MTTFSMDFNIKLNLRQSFKILSLLGGDTISSLNSILGEIHTVGGKRAMQSVSQVTSPKNYSNSEMEAA